jgi:hypothetical protein
MPPVARTPAPSKPLRLKKKGKASAVEATDPDLERPRSVSTAIDGSRSSTMPPPVYLSYLHVTGMNTISYSDSKEMFMTFHACREHSRLVEPRRRAEKMFLDAVQDMTWKELVDPRFNPPSFRTCRD